MEAEQAAGPGADDEKQSLKDFSDEELLQIYVKNNKSYADTAWFINTYFDVPTSRQAVFKRMQRYAVQKTKVTEDLKEQAKKALLEAIMQTTDVKLKINAAKIILSNDDWF